MAESDSYTPIVIYKSETASAVPAASKLRVGELAVNISDGKIYTKATDESIVELSGGNLHTHTSSDVTDLTTTVNNLLTTALRPTVTSIGLSSFTMPAAYESNILTIQNACTITVDTNANVSIPVGFIVHIYQAGSGVVTVAAAGGVTITSAETLKTRKTGATLTLIKIGTDSWFLIGDMELS